MRRGKGLVIGGIVALLAVAAAAFFLGNALGVGRAPAAAADEGPHYPGPMYVMKDRVVNLTDQGGRKYLKASLSIEFSRHAEEFRKASTEARKEKQKEFDEEISPHVPVIEDALIRIIASKSTADISTDEGKQRLKDEVKERLNHLLGEGQVTNVYFTQFVMQ